jgi:Uma2 family endonuclease
MTTQEQLATLVLELLPPQGRWSEQAYLWLTDQSNRLIEFTDGYVEVLPMPTQRHQAISRFLFLAFFFYLQPRAGTVFYAPLRLRVRDGEFREPGLLLMRDAGDPRRQDRYWLGADLVAEIVSPDEPHRDLVDKHRDYAEAGIPDYWIVNPLDETITVLRLQDGHYAEHGIFRRGSEATSVVLSEFRVAVSAVFDAS